MDDYRLAIGREAHVELDSVGALRQRQLEGGQRVLGSLACGAPMAED
jgi:hypothetical protein